MIIMAFNNSLRNEGVKTMIILAFGAEVLNNLVSGPSGTKGLLQISLSGYSLQGQGSAEFVTWSA